MPIPEVFNQERTSLNFFRRIWGVIRNSKLYERIRCSRLNPYQWGVPKIEADTLENAIEKAREQQKVRFIYKHKLHSAERDYPVYQECKEGGPVLRGTNKKADVRDNIPRNEKGELDLFAEEPIIFAVVPITGPALIGHVGMEYDGHVMNRLLPSIHTDSIYKKYREYTEYYFVYPSKLGLKPHDVIRAIDKHNMKNIDKKYNLLTNNCAGNVGRVLKSLGINDIDFIGPDKLGIVFTNPGNNPFNTGIKAWCLKHGVHVTAQDVEKLCADKTYPDNTKYRENVRAVGKRHHDTYHK